MPLSTCADFLLDVGRVFPSPHVSPPPQSRRPSLAALPSPVFQFLRLYFVFNAFNVFDNSLAGEGCFGPTSKTLNSSSFNPMDGPGGWGVPSDNIC